MAYISGKCVGCKEKTKQYAGEYSGTDENGVKFRGRMYRCNNADCDINIVRLRAEKDLRCKEDLYAVRPGFYSRSRTKTRTRQKRTHRT